MQSEEFEMLSVTRNDRNTILNEVASKSTFPKTIRPFLDEGDHIVVQIEPDFKEWSNQIVQVDPYSTRPNVTATKISILNGSMFGLVGDQKLYVKTISEIAEAIRPEFGYFYMDTNGGAEVLLSEQQEVECVTEATARPYLAELGGAWSQWLYVFGPSFVKKYGERELMALPAEKKIKLKYGGILIQLYNYNDRYEDKAKERSDAFKSLLLSKESDTFKAFIRGEEDKAKARSDAFKRSDLFKTLLLSKEK